MIVTNQIDVTHVNNSIVSHSKTKDRGWFPGTWHVLDGDMTKLSYLSLLYFYENVVYNCTGFVEINLLDLNCIRRSDRNHKFLASYILEGCIQDLDQTHIITDLD